MKKIKLFFLAFLFFSGLFAQKNNGNTEFKVSVNSFVSSGTDLPFWLTANKNGVITLKSNNYQLLQAGIDRQFMDRTKSKWDYTYGANLVYGYGGKSDFQANEYWGGVRYKWLNFIAGAKADPILYGGLSSTNGNIDQSNNARPLPGISFSSNGYIPFFFWEKWFSVKGIFEEKFFGDHAYAPGAHLHHKALYGRALLGEEWSVTASLEQYVVWGGTSPEYGAMPGIDQYLNYILNLKAGSGAFIDDQTNKAGNQLGNYSLEIKRTWAKSSLTFYWNHLFEDQSGIEMQNWCDGLFGLHYSVKDRSALVTDIVYEFMYTKNQSGSLHKEPAPTPENPNNWTGRGKDNYFDHFIYRSFSYYNRMIGTPLFVPIIGSNGVASGVESTRMWMHHIGLKGALSPALFWKTMLTYSRNFGTYDNAYPTWGGAYPVPLDEFSFLGELIYGGKQLPFQINVGLAGDYGKRFKNTLGGYAGISYQF
ncbi:MAG: capsule assembly Wzi family protein [Mariniphaga sp.]